MTLLNNVDLHCEALRLPFYPSPSWPCGTISSTEQYNQLPWTENAVKGVKLHDKNTGRRCGVNKIVIHSFWDLSQWKCVVINNTLEYICLWMLVGWSNLNGLYSKRYSFFPQGGYANVLHYTIEWFWTKPSSCLKLTYKIISDVLFLAYYI